MMLKDKEIERYCIFHPQIYFQRKQIDITGTTTKLIKIFQKSLPQGNEKQRLQGDIDRKGEK